MAPPNFSLGSRVFPGLAKVIEEAGEVQQIAGKLVQTGGAIVHYDGSDLSVRIAEEAADLSAACRVFFQLNDYAGAPWVLQREEQKYWQFLKWHNECLPDKEDTTVVELDYSPLLKRFGAGSDLHYQIYWANRVYPLAVATTAWLGFLIGVCLSLFTAAIWIHMK